MPRTRAAKGRRTEACRLRKVRQLLGLSQREMAELFGVAHGAIALWEGGRRTIPGPALVLLGLYEEEIGMGERDKTKGIEKLKTSWVSRTVKLSATGAKATARLAAGAVERLLEDRREGNSVRRSTQLAVARQMVDALGNMKGLVMKVGQMMSYLDYSVPQEVRDLLAALQTTTPPMKPAAIATVFLEDLGKTPRQLFTEWESEAFSAASIGQVHRARLHSGEEVAVKVQYPGIDKAIAADLRNIGLVDRIGSLLFRGVDRGVFVGELRERFMEECDYLKEAASQEEFARLFQADARILIPRTYGELTSKRILTMDYVRGQRFQQFRQGAAQKERQLAGEVIWDFAFESMFRHRLFNADPHPGNYLFADGRVVFLDFGCVKRFGADMSRFHAIVRSVLEQNRSAFREALLAVDFTREPEQFDFDYCFSAFSHLYTPWLIDQPFAYTEDFIRQTLDHFVIKNPDKFRTNVVKDLVFSNRIQWGLFSILAALGTTLNWRRKFLPFLYGDARRWPPPLSAEPRLLAKSA